MKVELERTLVLVKPDGVKRGLIGESVKRIEQRGLKVIAMKMVLPDEALISKHLPSEDAWVERLGEKTLKTFAEYKLDPKEYLDTEDKKEIGTKVKKTIVEFLISGPVVALVVEGIHAIDMVRKIAGNTLPVFANPGTIRGDFSVDSPAFANVEGRSIKNIVHASENPEEATNEVGLWFSKDELFKYERSEEKTAF